MCVCVHKNSRAHEISSEIIFVSYLPSSAFRADILCHNEKSVRTCHFLAHLQGTKTLGLSLKHTHAVSIQQLEGWVGHSPPEFFPHSQIRHLSMWAPFGSASLVGPLPAQRLVLQQPPPHGLPLLESHWPPRIGGGGGRSGLLSLVHGPNWSREASLALSPLACKPVPWSRDSSSHLTWEAHISLTPALQASQAVSSTSAQL